MAGLSFFRTSMQSDIVEFYTERLGMGIWLKQKGCTILKHGNLLIGFCRSESSDTQGTITLFYDSRKKVDSMYELVEDIAVTEPKENKVFDIYNFFAKDPEGRSIEFQTFLHTLEPYMDCIELLQTRRSIRYFKEKTVADGTLWKIYETCRYSPTSRNSQSYYFIPIYDKYVQKSLAKERGGATEPIENAPMAMAICSNPELSERYKVDGIIAGYHFMLAAWSYGLGTCWIADMDREKVKDKLGVPWEHYVVTVTPLGYPDEEPEAPRRKEAEELIQILGEVIT